MDTAENLMLSEIRGLRRDVQEWQNRHDQQHAQEQRWHAEATLATGERLTRIETRQDIRAIGAATVGSGLGGFLGWLASIFTAGQHPR